MDNKIILQRLMSIRRDCERLWGETNELIDVLTGNRPAENGESLDDCHQFKGRKVESIIFGNGQEKVVPTWKNAVAIILKDCDSDPHCHENLIFLRGRITGKNRVLLAEHAEDLQVPIQISEELFFEGKFDTESLLRVMRDKVLKPVGYDYSGLRIVCRRK